MSSRAVQLSITQVGVGVLIGGAIEAALPKAVEQSSLLNLTFEALVQVGLNGAALASFATLVRGSGEDPTYGIPFSIAVYGSQPELQKRIGLLSAVVRRRVSQVVQQTAGQLQEGGRTSRSM